MKKCGIYVVENKINNKKYIGQSTNIESRWKIHNSRLSKNCHNNKHLQLAWNKYGKNNFVFKIIEECSKEALDKKEKYFIKFFKSDNSEFGYNVTKGGKSFSSENMTEKMKISCSINGKKAANKIRYIKLHSNNKCKQCGKETENGYHKYCSEHKYKCCICGKRYNRNKKTSVCEECIKRNSEIKCIICKTLIIKNSNSQKMCHNCAKEIRKKQSNERKLRWRNKHG